MKVFVSLIIIFLISEVAQAQEKVTYKLNNLVLPTLNFVDTPLSDAVAFIQQKSVELDPSKMGVNVVILAPELRNNLVTLKLSNASLSDVLRYTTLLAGAHLNTTKFAVTISRPPTNLEAPEKLNTESIEAKMKALVIPSVEFFDMPLVDALDFLALKSGEMDPSKVGGFNIIYRGNRETDGQAKVTLRLSNIPFQEALKYTVQIAGHNFTVEPNAIVVSH